MGGIVTVTLNPAIDQTVWIDRLVAGQTHRTQDFATAIGGKGINVARTVARLGVEAYAIGITGEDRAVSIERHLASLGISSTFLPTPGETRTNLKLIEQSNGRLTEINGTGPAVTQALIDRVEAELLSTVARIDAVAVVLAGSLPLGADPSIYARWTRLLNHLERPVRVLADASDEALGRVVEAAPFLLKPNRSEAEGLLGRPIDGIDGALEAARAIGRMGPEGVLLSLGPAGAVAEWNGTTEVLPPPSIDLPPGRLLTTVGAGDAMVARMAVELAHRGRAAHVAASDFFDMCRRAVDEASHRIGAGVVSRSADGNRTAQQNPADPLGGAVAPVEP
jgi:1-phosphofructokinase